MDDAQGTAGDRAVQHAAERLRHVDSMVLRDEEHVTRRDLMQPRVAVRVSVRLVRDLPGGPTARQAREAVCAVGADLETAGRLVELAGVVGEHGQPLRAGEVVLLDSFGMAVPLTGDGRYAAEVDGRVVASILFGASRPTRPEETS